MLTRYFVMPVLLVASGLTQATPPPAQGADFITVFEQAFGRHPGERKGHAKGVCAVGQFYPAAEARMLSRSPLVTGGPVPAVLRFSMAGGNPNVADNARSPRGLAVQFRLPDGSVHNMAGLNTPVFAAATPETFLGLLKAGLPDADGRRDPARVEAFRVQHPDTRGQWQWLQDNLPPWSYLTSEYHGLHTFFLVDAGNQRRAVRWHLLPADGVRLLTEAEMAAAPVEFLAARLQQALEEKPARFQLQVTLAGQGDDLLDPAIAWPDTRQRVSLGTLEISHADDASCNQVNFDPTVLADGIEASEDPFLRIRSAAYAISFGKRLSGQ